MRHISLFVVFSLLTYSGYAQAQQVGQDIREAASRPTSRSQVTAARTVSRGNVRVAQLPQNFSAPTIELEAENKDKKYAAWYQEEGADTVPSPSDRLIPQNETVENWGDSVELDTCGCNIDCNTCCGPCWTTYVGGVFMKRENHHGRMFVMEEIDDGGGNAVLLYDSADFDVGYEEGLKLGVIKHNICDSCWDFEAVYFGINDWDHTMTQQANTVGRAIAIPFLAPNPALEYDSLRIGFSTELYSLEFNLRKEMVALPHTTFIIGFRWMELNDELTFQGVATAQANTVAGGNNDLTGYIRTFNNLYGLNLGLDSILLSRGALDVRAVVKAGFYLADERHKSNFTANTTGLIVTDNARSRAQSAFSAQADLTGVYHINNNWSVEAGYQVMWIEGVAVVFDQTPGSNLVDTNGDPFYHGALLNLIYTH